MTEIYPSGNNDEYYVAALDAVVTLADDLINNNRLVSMISLAHSGLGYEPTKATTNIWEEPVDLLREHANSDMLLARRALYHHLYKPARMSTWAFRYGIAHERAEWERADCVDDYGQTAVVTCTSLVTAEWFTTAYYYVLRYYAQGQQIVPGLGLMVTDSQPQQASILSVKASLDPAIPARSSDIQDWLAYLGKFDEDTD